jgi:hypothetical protein
MRDILDTLNLLIESTGLAGRKPGDTFRNPNGEEITFNDLKLFPEEGGKYSFEQLEKVLDIVNSQQDIKWMNIKSGRTGGFAIASFDSPEGPVYFGRYLESIKPSFRDNYLPNEVGEYKFAGKAAAKAQAGLSPQDLLTTKDNLTAKDILKQLSTTLGTDNPLYLLAYKIAKGEEFPIEFPAPEGISFTAFRDYFCEILQPIALQQGQYTGNAGEAAEIFLDGSFAGTVISFDTAKTAGLSDSIMTNPDGKFIKVSTKGGKGAQASAKNLIDSVKELQQTPAGKKLLKKYKDEIDLIDEIFRAGQAGAPLMLGIKFDIITDDEADKIKNLKNHKPINLENIKELKLGKNLEKLALNRETNDPKNTNMYYHLIAAIAHKAAIKVNDETNFSKAASDILNNGALVQVYTKAKQSPSTWTLNSFDTVYPGESIKGVFFSAGKTYYSTAIKGNFTFKIDKGSGKPKEDDEEKTTAITKSASKPLAKAAKAIIEPRHKKKKPTVEPNVGRSKRKR